MARPTTITNEQILDAAREVFLEEGFSAATASIAQRAGVSEGSIFKRFKSKDSLFLAAMGIPEPPQVTPVLPEHPSDEELQAAFVQVTVQLVEFFRQAIPRFMMLWSSKLSPLEVMRELAEPPPLKVRRELAVFFAEQIKRGRIRNAAPEVLARLIVGSTMEYAHAEAMREVVGAATNVEMAPEPFAKELIRVLWRGIAPGSGD